MLSGWSPSSEVAGIHFPHRCSPSWLLFSCSVVSSSLRPHGLQHCQASLSFTISWSLLKLMSIESVTLSNYLLLCHPFLLLPSVFPSISVFSNELASLHRVAKVLELQFQHQSFQ